jgi:hypothetical protein
VATTTNIANIIFRHAHEDAGFTRGMEAAAAAATKAAAAGEKVTQSTEKTTREVRTAVPAWSSVNKQIDENAKLAAATERANRQLEARLASLRQEAARNAEVAANMAQHEQRLIQLRDEAVRKAAENAAKERQRWQGVAEGTNAAANGVRGFGAVAASAGQQIQDVVVQAQMGTNAFTILAQQGSQFAGIFGPAGAMVGAGIALGAVTAQMLGLAGATKDLDDVLKENEANFNRLNAASKERAAGIKSEAEAVDSLRNNYAAMGQAAARAEGVVLARQQRALNDQGGDLLERLGGRLAGDLRRNDNIGLPSISGFTDVTGELSRAQSLAPDLTAAAEAFRKLRDETGPTVDGLRAYILALDDAQRAGGANAAAIRTLRDAAIDALPQVTELEKAQRQNAIQAAAMRLAAGQSAEALLAAGQAAGTAGPQFNALSGDIVKAAQALDRLRRNAVNDPLRDVNAAASRIADLNAALRAGGTVA